MSNDDSDQARVTRYYLWYPCFLILGLIFVAGLLWGYPAFNETEPGEGKSKTAKQQPSEETEKQIRGLGYAGGVKEAPEVSGVQKYREEASYQGYNLYVAGHATKAYLTDMQGNVVHSWSLTWNEAFPDVNPHSMRSIFNRKKTSKYANSWRKIHLYENGDLLAIYEGFGIVKIDKNSNLLWKKANKAHHDMWVDNSGTIYVLTRTIRTLSNSRGRKVPIVSEFVSVLDKHGKVKKRVSLLEAIRKSQYTGILNPDEYHGILLHTNSIRKLGEPQGESPPAFQPGRILLSFNKTNNIVLLDLNTEKIVWALPAMSNAQHDAQLMNDGNILFFNNNMPTDEGARSQVLEVDPITQELKWEYRGNSSNGFHSKCCGTNQRLPNGNTLITETGDGRAFEVKPDGTIVWEYVIPHRAGRNNQKIAQLFELERIPAKYVNDWIDHR